MKSEQTGDVSPALGLKEAIEWGTKHLKKLEKGGAKHLKKLVDERKRKPVSPNASNSTPVRKKIIKDNTDGSAIHYTCCSGYSTPRKKALKDNTDGLAFHDTYCSDKTHTGLKVYLTEKKTTITKEIKCDHCNNAIEAKHKKDKYKEKSCQIQTPNTEKDNLTRKSKKKKDKYNYTHEADGKNKEIEKCINCTCGAIKLGHETDKRPQKKKRKKKSHGELESISKDSLKSPHCIHSSHIECYHFSPENEYHKNESRIKSYGTSDENLLHSNEKMKKKKKTRSTSPENETNLSESPKQRKKCGNASLDNESYISESTKKNKKRNDCLESVAEISEPTKKKNKKKRSASMDNETEILESCKKKKRTDSVESETDKSESPKKKKKKILPDLPNLLGTKYVSNKDSEYDCNAESVYDKEEVGVEGSNCIEEYECKKKNKKKDKHKNNSEHNSEMVSEKFIPSDNENLLHSNEKMKKKKKTRSTSPENETNLSESLKQRKKCGNASLDNESYISESTKKNKKRNDCPESVAEISEHTKKKKKKKRSASMDNETEILESCKKKKRTDSVESETDKSESPKTKKKKILQDLPNLPGTKYVSNKDSEYDCNAESVYDKEEVGVEGSNCIEEYECKKKNKKKDKHKNNSEHNSEMVSEKFIPSDDDSKSMPMLKKKKKKRKKEEVDDVPTAEYMVYSMNTGEEVTNNEKCLKIKKKNVTFFNSENMKEQEMSDMGINTITFKSSIQKSKRRSSFGISPLSRLLTGDDSLCNTCWESHISCSTNNVCSRSKSSIANMTTVMQQSLNINIKQEKFDNKDKTSQSAIDNTLKLIVPDLFSQFQTEQERSNLTENTCDAKISDERLNTLNSDACIQVKREKINAKEKVNDTEMFNNMETNLNSNVIQHDNETSCNAEGNLDSSISIQIKQENITAKRKVSETEVSSSWGGKLDTGFIEKNISGREKLSDAEISKVLENTSDPVNVEKSDATSITGESSLKFSITEEVSKEYIPQRSPSIESIEKERPNIEEHTIESNSEDSNIENKVDPIVKKSELHQESQTEIPIQSAAEDNLENNQLCDKTQNNMDGDNFTIGDKLINSGKKIAVIIGHCSEEPTVQKEASETNTYDHTVENVESKAELHQESQTEIPIQSAAEDNLENNQLCDKTQNNMDGDNFTIGDKLINSGKKIAVIIGNCSEEPTVQKEASETNTYDHTVENVESNSLGLNNVSNNGNNDQNVISNASLQHSSANTCKKPINLPESSRNPAMSQSNFTLNPPSPILRQQNVPFHSNYQYNTSNAVFPMNGSRMQNHFAATPFPTLRDFRFTLQPPQHNAYFPFHQNTQVGRTLQHHNRFYQDNRFTDFKRRPIHTDTTLYENFKRKCQGPPIFPQPRSFYTNCKEKSGREYTQKSKSHVDHKDKSRSEPKQQSKSSLDCQKDSERKPIQKSESSKESERKPTEKSELSKDSERIPTEKFESSKDSERKPIQKYESSKECKEDSREHIQQSRSHSSIKEEHRSKPVIQQTKFSTDCEDRESLPVDKQSQLGTDFKEKIGSRPFSRKPRIYFYNCKPKFRNKYQVARMLNVNPDTVYLSVYKLKEQFQQDVCVRFDNEEAQIQSSRRAKRIRCEKWNLC